MTVRTPISSAIRLVATWVLSFAATFGMAQEVTIADSITPVELTETELVFDDTLQLGRFIAADTLAKPRRDWNTWRPDPKRAMWLAIVLPGAGQIYNRKYWKLPIIYGGFVGCIYAMRWNNMMYNDYSRAFLDISDNNPATQSYNQFLHLGNRIDPNNENNETRYKSLFKKRKDYYRRYRDLSFFILIGVYALSVIDAYVDASLSDFDISKDLSLKVSPTVISNRTDRNPIKSSAIGLHCSLNF